MYALQFLVLIAINLLSLAVGYILTNKIYLPNYSDFFQFKPFRCQKCMTFHIDWIISTFVSLLFNNYIMLIFGLIFSFGLFILLYLDEKERFIQ